VDSVVTEAGYADFSRRLHRQCVRERTPVNGAIEVTRRCSLACAHCYNRLPLGDEGARERELNLGEHLRLLDELQQAGCLWLLYTGGEVFARPDFLDIYRAARERGFLVSLFTNATLITPEIADAVADMPPLAVEVTVYGHSRETYESVTGVPGSYERCMHGISLLRERGLELKLKTMVLRQNRHELWQLQRFAEEDMELPFKFDAMISPRLDGAQTPLRHRLDPADVVALDLAEPRRMEEWRRFCSQFVVPVEAPSGGPTLYSCGAGVFSFSIDPYGGLSVCTMDAGEFYDLRSGSFDEGWRGFLADVRTRQTSRISKCSACELRSLCGMCPANARLENGDPEEPVDFMCHVAHLRALAFGVETAPHGECEYCPGGSRHDELLAEVEMIRKTATQSSEGVAPPLESGTARQKAAGEERV